MLNEKAELHEQGAGDIPPRRAPYPSDISDVEWEILEPLLPGPAPTGRPREVDLREVVNAIRYRMRTGCQWRALPHDLPEWGKVYYYFREWRIHGVWHRINEILVKQDRKAVGREPTPSAAIVDSQSVKATEEPEERGYDAGKKVKGTKRQIIVDTDGRLFRAKVHAANLSDNAGGQLLLEEIDREELPRMEKIWVDQGYKETFIVWVHETLGWTVEVVKRIGKGFQVLPRRWVVERTLAWLCRNRVLSKDYERLTASSETLIYMAMSSLLLRRLATRRTSLEF